MTLQQELSYLERQAPGIGYAACPRGRSELVPCRQSETGVVICLGCIELMIDLLDQLPTRRFFRPLLVDKHIVAPS